MNEQIKEMYFTTASCIIISKYYNIPLSKVRNIIKQVCTVEEIEKIKQQVYQKKSLMNRQKQKEKCAGASSELDNRPYRYILLRQ